MVGTAPVASLALFRVAAAAEEWASLSAVPLVAPPAVPDAKDFKSLVLCGYQGWFRTRPNNTAGYWQHWGDDLKNGTGIMEDYWPDLSEFTPEEKFAAPGYFFEDGSQAYLFSSDNARTVMRHFEWMETYGIDGVALQSFTPLGNISSGGVLNKSLAAAEATGRALYVEYDLSGYAHKGAEAVAMLEKDWFGLVAQGVTTHDRYVHQDGLPVVGVFGFYMDRFSPEEAAAILDVFKGKAFVAGAGQWYWRSSSPSPAWEAVFYNMSSWSPWNAGNWNGDAEAPAAAVGYWAADIAAFEKHGVAWIPEIYAGMSTNHRDGTKPGSGRIPRNKGAFFWPQFVAAAKLGRTGAFIGMFDELDEGTQILKVVNEPPPTATGDIGYEGLPSDCYLVLAGLGTKMLKGQVPLNETTPDCAALTKPTTPFASASSGDGTLRWTPASALRGGGRIAYYEILVDDDVRRTHNADTTAIAYDGTGVWRVRAVNTLGNAGGWSPPRDITTSGLSPPGE